MSYVNYFKPLLTSAEAYRVVHFFLTKCHEVSKVEYAYWLANALDTDPAIMCDWEDAVKEVLKEREKVGNAELVNTADNFPVYKECGCWDKQIEAHHKAIGKK
jgi:hypothetical protein